jgi:hypothetical protein
MQRAIVSITMLPSHKKDNTMINKFYTFTILTAAFVQLSQASEVQCQADKAKVKVSSKKELSRIREIKEAYLNCVAKKNKEFKQLIQERIQVAQQDTGSNENAKTLCKLMEPELMLVSSWVTGFPQPHPSHIKEWGITGGDYTYLIKQSVSCGPVGTSASSGIAGNVFVKVDLNEVNEVNLMGPQNKLMKETLDMSFSTKVDLSY